MSESNLLQEIDEELQRQRMQKLWDRYGGMVVAAALLIVLGTAGVVGWRHHAQSVAQSKTYALVQLLDAENMEAAQRLDDLKSFADKNDGQGVAIVAALNAAAAARHEGKTDEAVALYDKLASDSKVEPFFRRLADLLSVETQFDKGDPTALRARLEPLMTDSAWRLLAKEMSAHLALKAGDKAEAKKLFLELAAETDGPPSVPERANDMLHAMEDQ